MKTDSHLPQFADLMSEYVNFISGIGKCDYITRIYLNSFAKYCMNHGGVLSDDIISGWASRTDKESYYTNRNRCIILRRFIRYIRSKYGAPFKLPSYPPDIKYTPKPKRIPVSEQPYSYSAISHIVKKYELYKRASGKFSRRTMDKIRRFNDFCARTYPSAEALTEEIVLDYCKKKKTESAKSCNNRIVGVRGFLKYANSRGFVNIPLPSTIPRVNVTSFEPHPFTPEELARFFNEADNLEPPINCRDMRAALMKVEVPVFFRLLYSTGMRTTEARLLRVEDVDLQSGVINIRYTKSIDEHRVALHESMWSLLQMYNVKMENLMPGRKTFFPNEYDKPYSGEWVTASFKKVWKKVSTAHARAYDFRSHYAVVNINGWDHCGIEWMDKLLYLSRSMGHRYIQNTLYYYRLVPLFAHQLENLTGCGYEELLPDLNDYFEYED